MMSTLMAGCAAFAILALMPPAQAAPPPPAIATLAVHGKSNCLEVDYRKVAFSAHLEPGRYTATLDVNGPGIAYGDSTIYEFRRTRNVLLDFDNTRVSALGSQDAPLAGARPIAAGALALPAGHLQTGELAFLVKAPTRVYAYVIDRDPSDNAGAVLVRIHGKAPDGRETDLTLAVDGRRNCVKADLRKVARSVTLSKGEYHIELGDGAIVYGEGEEHKLRAARNVLIDLDPADVDLTDVECGGPGEVWGGPVAAFALYPQLTTLRIRVLRETTLYAYVIDYHADGNSGVVTAKVMAGLGGL